MDEVKPKHPGGRPTDYNPEIAARICELVATTTHGLKKLTVLNPELPHMDTIYVWRYRHKEFAEQYAEAKRKQADLLAEEIINIADDGLNDTYINDDGKVMVDHDVVQRSRLRIDTRKWIACKLLPKVYGERVQVDNDNGDQNELAKIRELVAKCLPKE